MVKVVVTFTDGTQEVFKDIDEKTVKVDGNILKFEKLISLYGGYNINLDHVRSWVVKL